MKIHSFGRWAAGAMALFAPLLAIARLPVIDDAFALKSVSTVAVNHDGQLLAVESGGGILILAVNHAFAKVQMLKGTHPVWSPDGRTLAYYALDLQGESQVFTWEEGAKDPVQVTSLPDGVSANPYGPMFPDGDSQALTWSPDSRQLAFCSRRMLDYRELGKGPAEQPLVRVLTQRSSLSEVYEGIFREPLLDAASVRNGSARRRAIEQHSEFARNHLLLVDLATKQLRTISTSLEPFYPAWSPDGRRIAVVGAHSAWRDFAWDVVAVQRTDLLLLDLANGREEIIPPARPLSGPPHWSGDGTKLAIMAKDRMTGFTRSYIYVLEARHWMQVELPGGLQTLEVSWSPESQSLLLLAADRFVNSFWRIKPDASEATRIDIGDAWVEGHAPCPPFTESAQGDLYFVSSSATYSNRVSVRSHDSVRPLQPVFDPNPQLAEISFGQQRRITWTNRAGDEVDGVLILPPGYEPSRRYPVIVDLYPTGPKDRFFMGGAHSMGQLQAARGYIVFRPALRTPVAPVFWRDENYTLKARGVPGIAIMVDDLSSGIDYLVNQGITERHRIGLFGHSFGSGVLNFLITETNLANCAVESGTNVVDFTRVGTPTGKDNVYITGNLYENFSAFTRMSPFFRLHQVQCPLFFFLGDQDQLSLVDALYAFDHLQQLGKDVTLVRYKNGGHTLLTKEDIKDAFERVLAFFNQHLFAETKAPAPGA